MYVRRLELLDFRSYPQAFIDLESGPAVLVGPNGVGKTNLVEALGYVATLASHRVSNDAPLVRVGATRAVVRCVIVHEGRELHVELEIVPGRANRARLGRSPVTRARDILGALRMVMFAPEDLALVRGDPAERRRYLDELLVARQPRYAGVRADYERVLKQRNALLRTAYLARKVGRRRGRAGEGRPTSDSAPPDDSGGDLATLDVWDTHLARHGAELADGRLQLCASLGPHVAKSYAAVSAAKGEARLAYEARSWWPDGADAGFGGRAEIEEALLRALSVARPSEIDRGVTLAGPHRDDLSLTLGELPVKGYASHGESWSYALALRLAAFELLRADRIEPVLVLDDVFAELDTGRRERLAGLVAGADQVLVTCAVPEDVPPSLAGARYVVTEGQVARA